MKNTQTVSQSLQSAVRTLMSQISIKRSTWSQRIWPLANLFTSSARESSYPQKRLSTSSVTSNCSPPLHKWPKSTNNTSQLMGSSMFITLLKRLLVLKQFNLNKMLDFHNNNNNNTNHNKISTYGLTIELSSTRGNLFLYFWSIPWATKNKQNNILFAVNSFKSPADAWYPLNYATLSLYALPLLKKMLSETSSCLEKKKET